MEMTGVEQARKFVSLVKRMAKRRNLNMFIVTDGASATLNNGNKAVRNARQAHIKWEIEHGFNPNEDYGNGEKK
jgi:hypothetical protein